MSAACTYARTQCTHMRAHTVQAHAHTHIHTVEAHGKNCRLTQICRHGASPHAKMREKPGKTVGAHGKTVGAPRKNSRGAGHLPSLNVGSRSDASHAAMWSTTFKNSKIRPGGKRPQNSRQRVPPEGARSGAGPDGTAEQFRTETRGPEGPSLKPRGARR